jgi:hypothetical protein
LSPPFVSRTEGAGLADEGGKMKIRFQEDGGLVARFRGCVLDTEQLSPAEAASLEALVEQIQGEDSVSRHSELARDASQYEITIEKGGQTYRLAFDDLNVPTKVRPLLKFLQKHARPQPIH